MRNEYEPIRRYGAVLNDVVLKARIFKITGEQVVGQLSQEQKIIAVNAELFDQLGFAIGDVERTFGGFANQQRYMEAQFANLQTTLGDGLRPAFTQVLEAANGFLGILRQIPEPIAEIGGAVALAATSLLALGGGALFAVGKMGQLTTTMREGAVAMKTMQTSSNALIRTLGKAGPYAALAAGAFIAIQAGLEVANSITGVEKKATEALEQFNVEAKKGPSVATYKEFIKVIDATNDKITMSDAWTEWGRRISLAGADAVVTIESMQEAIDRLALSAPPEALMALEATLQAQLTTIPKGTQEYDDLSTTIDYLNTKIGDSVTELQLQGQALDPSLAKKYGDEQLNNAQILEDLTKAMEKAREEIEEINKDFEDGAKFAEIFGDNLDDAFGTPQFVTNIADINSEVADLFDSFKDDEGNIDKSRLALDVWTESGRDNLAAIEGISDAMNNELIRAYQDSGGDMEAAKKKAQELNDSFFLQYSAIGLTAEEMAGYQTLLGLTPEQVETVIKLSKVEEAKTKLDLLNLDLAQLTKPQQLQFTAAIDRGDFVRAWEIANEAIVENGDLTVDLIAQESNPIPAVTMMQRAIDVGTPLLSKVFTQPTDPSETMGILQDDINRKPPLTKQTDAKKGDTSVAKGEMQTELTKGGPLSVISNLLAGDTFSARRTMQNDLNNNPLTQPVKLSVTAASRYVAGQIGWGTATGTSVPSTGGLTAVPAMAVAGQAAPTSTPTILNFNFRLPVGTDEVRTVNALKKYAQHYGRVPIRVA
jgi:hypothetical protein